MDLDPPGEKARKAALRFGLPMLLILADTYKRCLVPLGITGPSGEKLQREHTVPHSPPGKMSDLWGTGQSAGSAP